MRKPPIERRRLRRRVHRVADDILDLSGPVARTEEQEARRLFTEATGSYIEVLDARTAGARRVGRSARALDRVAWQLAATRAALTRRPAPQEPKRRWGMVAALIVLVAAVAVAAVAAMALRSEEAPVALGEDAVAVEAIPDPSTAPNPSTAPDPTTAPAPTTQAVEEPPETVTVTAELVAAESSWTAVEMGIRGEAQVAVGVDGWLLVAGGEYRGPDLNICYDAECLSHDDVEIARDQPVGGPTMVIGPDGSPAFSWFAVIGQAEGSPSLELRYARCARPDCGGRQIDVATLAATAYEVLPHAMALDAEGLAAVVFTEPDGSAVRMVRCRDRACGEFSTHAIAEGRLLSLQPAVGIGPDGHPLVSYFDIDGQQHHVARCADSQCTGIESTAEIDLGLRREVASVVRFHDGLPVIVYGVAGEVGVLWCHDAGCAGDVTRTVVPLGQGYFVYGLSAEVDGGGGVHIVFNHHEAGMGFARYLHCAEARCAEFVDELVPTPESWSPALSLAEGEPLIAAGGVNNNEIAIVRRAG